MAVRALVFLRDIACRICFGMRMNWVPDQMHEIVPRSKTRGMDPVERFNTQNCIRLCAACHTDVQTHLFDIIPRTDQGADGRVDIVRHVNKGEIGAKV